ncbi:hypothetical protein [Echinicola strongylocentroti]|nr:hypothetical protein [Echinicola strongylocentroti]
MNENVLDNGNYKGFQFLDINNEVQKDANLSLSLLSSMGVVPESFGYYKDEILFFHPFQGVAFKVDEGNQEFVPWVKIDFGEKTVPPEVWKSDDPELLFGEVKRNNYAFAPFCVYFDGNSDQLFFYYYVGFIDTIHLGLIDLESGVSKVISGIENDLYLGDWQKPQGMSKEGNYLNMIHLSHVPEKFKVKNQLTGDPESPVVLSYQVDPIGK